MRSEFEKLPQIESHLHNVVFDEGSNKYLTKKMGYLPFEFSEWFLNGSWTIYQHQQSKVDELKLQVAEMKSRLNDAYTDGQSAMYTARQSKVDELQKRVDTALKILSSKKKMYVDMIIEIEQALKAGIVTGKQIGRAHV